MILILSGRDDAHVPLVTDKLDDRGIPYLWFDPGDFPTRASIDLHVGGSSTTIALTVDGRDHDLGLVSAVWDRRPNLPIPGAAVADPTVRTYVELSSRHLLDGIWELLDCPWLPARPIVDRAAQNKPRQLVLAARLGLTVPDTLFTNRPTSAVDFFNAQSGVVSKSLVAAPVEVDGVDRPAMYTRPTYRRDLARHRSVRHSPVIFQEAIPKAVEIRATIVGDDVFAAEIHSQESRSTLHDWRHYHDTSVRYEKHTLPPDIGDLLRRLVSDLGLCFGAADLILTPSGQYVFLELNPNGQWGFVEQLTGLPLSDAVIRVLTPHERR